MKRLMIFLKMLFPYVATIGGVPLGIYLITLYGYWVNSFIISNWGMNNAWFRPGCYKEGIEAFFCGFFATVISIGVCGLLFGLGMGIRHLWDEAGKISCNRSDNVR